MGKERADAGDMVKTGETVEVVILGVNSANSGLSLGLKQALGDPWIDVAQKFPVGSVIEGPVTSITKFGAFVQLVEGVEGMVHVSEISAEKRINHPQDVVKVGETVKAQVLAVDTERRLIRLSMKQLVPTGLDEYIAEHNTGDVVSGRIIEETGNSARVELGEGIQATCKIVAAAPATEENQPSGKVDLSSLTSMLQNRWKGGTPTPGKATSEAVRAGQIRSFRITKLDEEAKRIELELA